MATNFRNRPASQHSFAMVPRADIPRSKFMMPQKRKQTFNAGDLVPIYCEEIVPGDHFKGSSSIFARGATPIVPVLDNAELETFFFFVPNRLVWENWEEFIAGGNFTIPQVQGDWGDFQLLSIYDQLGIPIQETPATATMKINALPLRAYNLIFNEWFRDQNLITELTVNTDNGPDAPSEYSLQKRAKKHDYFTSALPWPQKGEAVTLPLGTTAPVIPDPAQPYPYLGSLGWPGPSIRSRIGGGTGDDKVYWAAGAAGSSGPATWADGYATPGHPYTGLQTDLSEATAATINAIRTAFQIQRLLERDARGGTRYTELIQAHFGVRPPDYRLQRPEYLGGGRTMLNTHPIAQTSGTGATGEETPQGNLAAITTAHGNMHNFNYAATEHGYIIGLANVRTELTYQQGLRRHWSRQTRYDFYFPAFAHLGEQAILRKEIYFTDDSGPSAPANSAFGYQERWAEYRYTPSEITGLFRSTAPNPIDIWHYAEKFDTAPALNGAFITDPSETTFGRSLAVSEDAAGQQILMDIYHRTIATRPMPTYSVPGLIDHF